MGPNGALYALIKPIDGYAEIIDESNYSKATGLNPRRCVCGGPMVLFASYQVAFCQFLVLYPQGCVPLWKKMALKNVLSIGIFLYPRKIVSIHPWIGLEVLIGPCYP